MDVVKTKKRIIEQLSVLDSLEAKITVSAVVNVQSLEDKLRELYLALKDSLPNNWKPTDMTYEGVWDEKETAQIDVVTKFERTQNAS